MQKLIIFIPQFIAPIREVQPDSALPNLTRPLVQVFISWRMNLFYFDNALQGYKTRFSRGSPILNSPVQMFLLNCGNYEFLGKILEKTIMLRSFKQDYWLLVTPLNLGIVASWYIAKFDYMYFSFYRTHMRGPTRFGGTESDLTSRTSVHKLGNEFIPLSE